MEKNDKEKRIAVLHEAPTGWYHLSDDRLDYLDESGPGHRTKAMAKRTAARLGYTHVDDHTLPTKRLQRVHPE